MTPAEARAERARLDGPLNTHCPHGASGLAPGSSILAINRDLVTAAQALYECHAHSTHDLCGEQREWYVPRLRTAFLALLRHFPAQTAAGMAAARDPWGGVPVVNPQPDE